jgi:hypothetical protein
VVQITASDGHCIKLSFGIHGTRNCLWTINVLAEPCVTRETFIELTAGSLAHMTPHLW